MNTFKAWWKESWNRFFGDTPPFFKPIMVLGAVATAIAGIPDALIQMNVQLPSFIKAFADNVIWIAGIVAFVIAKLPVQRPAVGQTEEGGAIMVTDEKSLPFTADAESKQVLKTEPPPQVLPEVPEKPPEEK
jgi:hypothetical protein